MQKYLNKTATEENCFFSENRLNKELISESIANKTFKLPWGETPPKEGSTISLFLKVGSHSSAREKLLKNKDNVIPWTDIETLSASFTTRLGPNRSSWFCWWPEKLSYNGFRWLSDKDWDFNGESIRNMSGCLRQLG
ncbi:hypothetical protein SAMN06296036_105323 [Pseudobacteriovorax antillogorgiicola]|uniref:Uncharacterized protein n=1 Tax=Pseudobacteriovorax antillogorgiicola TaxID=1513793 RepID=A0A1Y6BJT6_9BACT|nr:hypothetical protein EDD56_1051 [Pseudobacteriovorax antillogorgiicola]SMF14841.1 hypothetical protein SAMN06296036_105323 [Pseudobacteriovorax antillogorgiicola]